MAEAQFIPGQGAGNIIGALNSGIGTSASLMERAQARQVREQQMRINEEENERRRQEFEILAPAVRAKATADVKKTEVELKGFEQAENARAAATSMLPTARAIFDDLMNLEDPDMRATAALQWIGQYGHLGNVAEFEGEFNSKKDIAAKMYAEAAALRQLKANIEGQKEVAGIRGQTAVEVAGIRGEASDKIGRYRALLEESRQSGDAEGVQLYTDLLAKASASGISSAQGSAQMQQRLEQARQAGDPEEIKFWENRINALNQRGVREDPAAKIKAIIEGLSGMGTPAAPATPAAAPAKPEAAPAPGRVRMKLSDLK